MDKDILNFAIKSWGLENTTISKQKPHIGGKNNVYHINTPHDALVLRISCDPKRNLNDYLAETFFVDYLFRNGASVVSTKKSMRDNFIETYSLGDKTYYLALFSFAPGKHISENGYKYIDGLPLNKYFYDTGKVLGKIHALSKNYSQDVRRIDYFDKFNVTFIDQLIPNNYRTLIESIKKKLEIFKSLPINQDNYGLIHFDFSDGNFNIDYSNGNITVYDFDNCINCWYMYDLANLWTHGVGWFRHISDGEIRMDQMRKYFNYILEGYKSECSISENELSKLPVYIDMVLIENTVDHFEVNALNDNSIDFEDIDEAVAALINDYEYMGFGIIK